MNRVRLGYFVTSGEMRSDFNLYHEVDSFWADEQVIEHEHGTTGAYIHSTKQMEIDEEAKPASRCAKPNVTNSTLAPRSPSSERTTTTMASATTASQEELKAHRIPLGWRDQCSACVGFTIVFTMSYSFVTSNIHHPPTLPARVNIASSSHLMSAGENICTCHGSASTRSMRMRSAYPFLWLF